MESTIEKLNQNRLMELTDKDYENIVNNTELKTLFLLKVKEGQPFDFEEAYVLEEELFSSEYIIPVFEIIKAQYPDQFIELFFADTSKIREQYDEKTAETIIKYLEDNMYIALSKLQHIDQTYEKIENQEIIDNIITNKLEKLYGSIYMETPTQEFEELLLEALDRIDYKYIHTITPRILKKCIETNKVKAAMYGVHPENPEETEIIIAALEQELITYSDLPYGFRDYHQNDTRIIKYRLRGDTHISISEENLKREEVRKLIIEEIERNHNLANDWGLSYSCEQYPEIALTMIKYWDKETLKDLISYKQKLISNLLKDHKEELIDAIIYNLEHNQSAIEEVIENFFKSANYYPEVGYEIIDHPRFFHYYISKVPMEKMLYHFISYEYHGEREYFIEPTKLELLSKANITFNSVPDNFNFKVDYPENIWLAVIPLLRDDQLIPSNIYLDRFVQYEKIFDCILLRLKELKSNVYNSQLEYWQGPVTQTLIDIVCDPTNPLNLNTTQKFNILPAAKMQNTKHLVDIIKQAEVITHSDLQVLIPTILKSEDLKEIEKLCNLFLSKIDKTPQVLNYLASISADVYGTLKNNEETPNISEQYITVYNCLKEYLKTQKDIPLTLTKNFDKEIAQTATYSNLEALSTNPSLFLVNGLAPHHFVEFIKECQSKNLPINLRLIHQAAKSSVSKQPYDYENITFNNDKETYEILAELLNCAQKDSIERKVIDNWVTKCLDYKFFDCQIEGNKVKLLDLLVINSDYTEQILEAIDADKIQDTTVLSSVLNKMLITEQNSPEITEKVLNTIVKLIEQDKLNKFAPQHSLAAYIELIDHPTFVDYVTRTYVSSIGSHTQDLELFIKDDKYKQAVLEALYKNTGLVNNINVLNLIKTVPEVKEYAKFALENNDNAWLEFNASYLDKELLQAYLKHHSIDKVITFIVHYQSVEPITQELYEIIKKELLEVHTEYNKESFDILENFYNKELLLLLETENFKKLLQKEPDVVSKFTEVFKERKLDEGIITSISDSFRQNYFNIENAHIINFYTNTLEKIQRGITEEEIQEVMNILINYIPPNLEKDLEATGNELLLNTYKVNKHDFLRMLIQELINNQNIYAPVFNKITNNLIVQKRNEYRSTQDIYKDTNLKYELDTKSLHNALFNYLSKNNPNELYNLIEYTEYDTDLNWKTIQFLSGKTSLLTKEEIPSIKRNIPKLKAAIIDRIFILNEKDKEPKKRSYWSWDWNTQEEPKKFPNLPRRYEYLLDIPEFMKPVKKIPIYPTRKKPTEMFGNINIEVFELLAHDEDKYQCLVALLNKYRFLEWDNLFEPTVQKLSLGEDAINIYNFINAFSKIYDNEKKIILRERKKLIDSVVEEMKKAGKTEEEINDYIRVKEAEPFNVNITAYKVLKYSTIYSSIANYYKIILGMEDFDLVKRNDGPNSSYQSAELRLQKASEMQLRMIELNEITIPSFIHDHETNKETKTKLRVTVGNRADSRNLTHGERTGACMRAYGHADSLFEFCNLDPRGFHIVFTDPETNEYVSRVSGFRNGNTVFLNQLRNSTSSKYTNQDVIDACKAAAEQLIERSKDSDMPIENVVASPYYALQGYETQQLSQHNIGEGVYTGYKDVNSNAVVLATTGENGLAVPLKLDGENQPVYEPVRLQPREYSAEQITDGIKISMQRITSIKQCLENKENKDYYKTIDFDYEILDTIYVYAIIGQDWYVALDNNGNIIHEIAVQNEHSIEELNEAIAKISTIKEEKQKIGGFTNGIQ